jgi:hypothetical protein
MAAGVDAEFCAFSRAVAGPIVPGGESRSWRRSQVNGIDQVAQALTNIEQMTQSTAAASEEGAAAAAELNGQSETLNGIVQQLAVVVGV